MSIQWSLWSLISCLCTTLLFGMDFQNNLPAPIVSQRATTDSVLTFFIRPCFCSRDCIDTDNLSEAVQDPNFMNKNTINYCLKSIKQQGINVAYYGMTTHSDTNGQVTFPRKQTSDDVLVVVTNKPKPILGQGVTVNRWVVAPETPVSFYTFTQHTINNQLTWHTHKIDTPTNRIIPPQAVVIIADPNEIVIHEGFTATIESPSLILPTIYTKKSINLDKDALLFLNINRYFSLTKKVVNYSQDRYASMVQP